jgi:L-aminopeptidase/D-esterase-like protein
MLHGACSPASCTTAAAALVVLSSFLGPIRTTDAQTPSEPRLVPRTSFDGPALELDFPGLRIGVAEYDEGPTGATVFHFPDGVMAAADVRGGAPGTIATDFLRLAYESSFVDAITFAGGSSYGLAAAAGAADAIRLMRERTGARGIATVPGAIIFDVGDRRFNMVVPDEALGRAALQAARPGRFPLGARGAGRFAMQSGFYGTRWHSGQGGAFRQIGDLKIAVFTIVNSLGAVVDRQGRVVRCSGDPAAECGAITDLLRRTIDERAARPDGAEEGGSAGPTRNTTLTLVVINRKLDFWALQRLAVQVHTSMARAIQPFHTRADGDVLFAVTTGAVEPGDIDLATLGVIASEVAWDAVLNSVPPLPARDTVSAPLDRVLAERLAGEYDFGQDTRLSVSLEGNRLFARAVGRQRIYGFPLEESVELVHSGDGRFYTRGRRGDRVRFLTDPEGRVTGLLLNPGTWALPARKLH